ncbi:integrase core domain-containing protein [Opitutales bacterium ASA1]|uniref:integrase core domain-containing protein n=1 Tax=Congregicoccus parvus TaxID=3081749 RepID=UPI002B2B54F6|nr:integrase core domain-containing protein [Opitutales bacterium ASA1]
MPWKTVTPMEEIIRFVSLARSDRFTHTDLCEQFGISRKTGYKYLERYALDGLKGLQPRSHRPHSSPRRTPDAIEALVLAERQLHRTWGPKKLRRVLEIKHGIEAPPACSTIAEMLRRSGLSARRHRRPGAYPSADHGLTEATQPNHVWTVDFKGWFILGDGRRCDPLTVSDLCTRFVIELKAQPNQQGKGTLASFRALAAEVGLPEIIRVDHGSPFASVGLGRLSALSIWWIEQGIEVEFTRPGKPQDNGAHERMHRDLKAEATRPPSANMAAQQRRFERWRHVFNHERPHEALGMRCPAQLYRPSARRLGEQDRPVVYPADFQVKVVSTSGFLAHEGHNYHLGEIFAGKRVGLRRGPDERTELYFANVHLGNLVFDPAERFRPTAYIAPPNRKSLATSTTS